MDQCVSGNIQEINDILSAIEFKVQARETPEYELGRKEGAQETLEQIVGDIDAFMKNTKQAAEFFNAALSQCMPEVKVKELRIGFNSSSLLPVAVAVISADSKDKLRKIHKLARQVECYLYEKTIFSGLLWTVVDDRMDHESLCIDFPFFRTVSTNA
jgi:ribosomal protein S7